MFSALLFILICVLLMSYNSLEQRYGWLNISSSVTMVVVDNTFVISSSFFHLPHSGISVIVDENVSSDGDINCNKNTGIRNEIVNYTCTAIRPSINRIVVQVTFCNIEFTSQPLTITIKAHSSKYNYIPCTIQYSFVRVLY